MNGAPLGNKNAAKAKLWEQALKRALARVGGSIDKGLDTLADKCVADAFNGDRFARDEIADRLDGKPKQSIEASGSIDHEHHHTHEHVSNSAQWLTAIVRSRESQQAQESLPN